ncbi:GNAT family N-acetyltransferase [Micromonospora sp. NPDC002389]|uniref:GNAT family N-acetyltransferase n=1 Tax=Micromonospora sp. NPDC002389 TaxID=3154272 RepID=UPI003318FFC0
MLIQSRPVTDPEVATLVAAWRREVGATGGPRDDGGHLVAVLHGRAVACGGVHELGDGVGELSGLYVRPAYRRQGIARHLLVALEEVAFRQGCAVLRVAVGAYGPVAGALYRSCGYAPVGAYLAKRLPLAA